MTPREFRLNEVKTHYPYLKYEVVAENDPSGFGLFFRSLEAAEDFKANIIKCADEHWDTPGRWNKDYWNEKPRNYSINKL